MAASILLEQFVLKMIKYFDQMFAQLIGLTMINSSLFLLLFFLIILLFLEFFEYFEQFLLLFALVCLLSLESFFEEAVLDDGALKVLAGVAVFVVHSVVENGLINEDSLLLIVGWLVSASLHHVLHFHLSYLLEDILQQCFFLGEQLVRNILGK